MTPIPAGWKLVEALRESLLWTASSLAAVGKEQDVITLEGRKRTIGEILDEANAALDAPSPASVAPGDAQEERKPLFWYRPRSDDGYEGPIHNDRIEDVRKRSGAWVPLYPGFAALPKPLSDLRYHGEFIRGWNQCLREVIASVAAPAAGDALAWQGLTDAERDGYVGELVDYGSDFVAPLYSVVESIEKRLREKNAALAAQVPHKGDAA